MARSKTLSLAASLGLVLGCGPSLVVLDEGSGGETNDDGDASGEGDETSDRDGGEGMSNDGATTSGGGGGLTDSGGDDDGVEPDVADPGYCDLWTQNCPSGYKCMPFADHFETSWNSTKCTPVADDPKGIGDDCSPEGSVVSGIDDCVKGAMCLDVDPYTNVGECWAQCTGSPQDPRCEDPNAWCSVSGNGVLNVCVPGCDPILQDCDDGDLCLLNFKSTSFNCVIDASQEGEGYPGDPCEFANTCQRGSACITGTLVPGCEYYYCCSEFCDVEAANTCALADLGAECVSIWGDGLAPAMHRHVGFCQLPS